MNKSACIAITIAVMIFYANAQGEGEQTKPSVLDVKSLKEDFFSLDQNQDGYVDAHELRTAMPGIVEDDISAFFDRYDADRDGALSLEEYLTVSFAPAA